MLKYHFSLFGLLAKIPKGLMSSVVKAEGEMGTLIHCCGNANWWILYGGDFGNTSKIRYGFTIPRPAAKTDCKKEWVLKKNKNTNSKRYMHLNVHSSIIHNCQDTEAT